MQLDLIDIGERLYPEGYKPSAKKKPPCTADTIGSGPEGETCRTCLHKTYGGNSYGRNRRHLKCALMVRAWTHGLGSDIKAKWPACSKWEPADLKRLIPPGFPSDCLDTAEGRGIVSDWWEERGELKAAARLRGIVEIPPPAEPKPAKPTLQIAPGSTIATPHVF